MICERIKKVRFQYGTHFLRVVDFYLEEMLRLLVTIEKGKTACIKYLYTFRKIVVY